MAGRRCSDRETETEKVRERERPEKEIDLVLNRRADVLANIDPLRGPLHPIQLAVFRCMQLCFCFSR